jgi:hypothetical protein
MVKKVPDRILSPSEINCFRNCRQSWVYSYIERRPKTRSGPARRIGTIVHAGLASWYSEYKGYPIGDCHTVMKAIAKKEKAQPEEIELATSIFDNYIVEYREDYKQYDPVIIEKKITGNKCGLKAIPDLVVLEFDTDKYYVVDHKVQGSLELNKAFDAQKIALYKVIGELYPISGIMYNLIRSKVPLIPEPIQNLTRLKKFAPESTTELLFKQALKTHGFKAADYPEYVKHYKDNKNENQFFKRVFVDITVEEMEEFEREVTTVREQMATGIIYRNRQWTCERNCDYYDTCFKKDPTSEKILEGGGN